MRGPLAPNGRTTHLALYAKQSNDLIGPGTILRRQIRSLLERRERVPKPRAIFRNCCFGSVKTPVGHRTCNLFTGLVLAVCYLTPM
jgi:hypothetical protein